MPKARRGALAGTSNAEAALQGVSIALYSFRFFSQTLNEEGMAQEDQQSVAPWFATADLPDCAALDGDQTVDVCVIGAGIAGLTAAYLLANAGKSVAVIEARTVGAGQTGRTTAHLTTAIDDRYFCIERLHGEGGARLVAESHAAAIDTIERIVRDEAIACGFERLDGFLFLGEQDNRDVLDAELNAAHRAGLTDVEWVECVHLDTTHLGPALRFPRQAQFHPLQYCAGLCRAIRAAGGRVYTNTRVQEITGQAPIHVLTQRGTVTATDVLQMTNAPLVAPRAFYEREAPYLTYVIGARVAKGSVRRGLFWDTERPSHYFRTQPFGQDDLLIVGGEDHKTGTGTNAAERYRRLVTWARALVPGLGEVLYQWSGQALETLDGIAYIGQHAERPHLFFATGDSGMGLTHATLGAVLLTDLVFARYNPWQHLYRPDRTPPRSLPTLVQAGAHMVGAEFPKESVTTGREETSAPLPRESGRVVKEHGEQIAEYCDPQGAIHRHSAVCTHQGCIVRWNQGEKTWDCPCHGSRFGPYGTVLNGPAATDLGDILQP